MLSTQWPALVLEKRMALMSVPASGRLPVVIDTDTYNEIDDQIALAWTYLHPERFDLQAVYAAPFTNHFFWRGEFAYVC